MDVILKAGKKRTNGFVFISPLTFIVGFIIVTQISFGQNNVGIGTNTPNSTAALEVTSPTNNQGVLVPRLTSGQRLAIVTPANGLLVYDVTLDCFYYYIAATSSWQSMCANAGPTGPAGAAGATGTAGANGSNGATGANGTNGTNGISCWDINGNGVNDPAEDVNGDGSWNVCWQRWCCRCKWADFGQYISGNSGAGGYGADGYIIVYY